MGVFYENWLNLRSDIVMYINLEKLKLRRYYSIKNEIGEKHVSILLYIIYYKSLLYFRDFVIVDLFTAIKISDAYCFLK